MTLILNILLLSCAIFIVAKFMASIHFKNIGTILTVAIVYSIINFLFGWIFFIVTFPLVVLTFGLFKFVINAFLRNCNNMQKYPKKICSG